MRSRDVAIVVAVLVVIAVGAMLFVVLRMPRAAGPVSVPDASDAPIALVPVEPEPDDDETDAVARPDAPTEPPRPHPEASAPSAVPPPPPPTKDSGHAAGAVVHVRNLKIHPANDPNLCVGLFTNVHGLHLFDCHPQKAQRWTIAEDPAGIVQIVRGPADAECVREGEGRLEVAPCGVDSAHFRRGDDKHFRDVASGRCMTAKKLESRAGLLLAPCDPANAKQMWTISQ